MRNLLLTSFALLLLAGCKQIGPPEAVATGPAEPVPVGGVVVLDGSASSDPQGRGLGFLWKLVSRPAGSTAEIADPTLATAWLTPDVEGPYQARLVVSNGVLTSEAAVAFTVQCGAAAPVVALTATPQESATGELVQLEGSFTDADLDPPCDLDQLHTLAWSLVGAPAGSAARLSATEGSKPFLTPDLPGVYRVRLAVTDSTGRAGEKTLEFTASQCGANAPVIEALSADPATVGASVQVRAMALDPDSAPPCSQPGALTYAWRFAAKPATSAARFNNPRLASPSFFPDVAGTYLVELVVTDSTRRTARAQLSIEVSGCGASAPSITAVTPSPAAPNVGQAVGLSAAVEDPDNAAPCSSSQLFGLRWSLVGLPAGSAAVLSDPQSLRPWFKADVAGEYRLSVEAFDDTGRASAPFAFSLQVSPCGSGVPVASIDLPAAAGVGRPVQAVSRVSDADTVAPCSAPESFRYAWSFAALPVRSAALLNGAALSAPSFVPDLPGDYVLRLVVTDSAGHRSAPAFATVAVSTCGANPPVAAASATPAAPNLGQPVLLTASATDADNDAFCLDGQSVSWQWAFESLPAGSRAALNSSTARQPSFTPDVAGDYVVRLIATDSTGRSSEPARVTLSATSCGGAVPIASASASPSRPAVGQAVLLQGAVADADNDAHCLAGQSFTYGWSFESLPAGSRAALNAPSALTPSFAPDLAGEYVLRFVAHDSTGKSSAPARVSVTASGCGANAPVATLTAEPASAHVGTAIRLVPAITDSDNEPACTLPRPQSFSYAWTLLSAPAGSATQLSDTRAREPSFVADFPGDYTARLIVTDSGGLSSQPADLTVSVNGCGANAPVIVSAEANPAVSAVGQTVELRATFQDADDGAGCQSALGTPFSNTFAWRVLSAPAASAAAISGADRLVAGFLPDLPGAYQLEITVTDPTGRSDTEIAALTVTPCGAAAPTVSPAVDPISRGHVNGFVVLHSNAQDADNELSCSASQHLDFQWWFQELPAGSRARFDDATRRDASFVPDVGGQYAVAVAATDSTGQRSAARTVRVDVDPCGGNPPVAQLRAALEGGPTFGPSADLSQIVIPACVRVLLDGTPSFDPDAACGLPQTSDSLGYQWQVVSAPAGATDPLQGSAAATRTFDAPVPSSLDDPYVVELKVSDGMLESAPARVTLVTDLFEITSVEPAMACMGNVPAQLTLLGNGFLRVNGFEPTVQFAPPGVQASLASMGGCTVVHPGIEACTELVIDVPFGGDTVGAHVITVTNPVGEACSASAVFFVGPPPFVASVTPSWACEGPSSFAIEGFGFGQTTAVSFNTTPADHLGYLSPFELTAGFDDLAPGLYDVTVSNGAGCSSTRPNAVTILQNPSVYFVDPEVIYSGIFVQATVYVSGINGASVSWLGIRPAGSSGAYQDLPYTYDPLRPNQVQAIIPAGLAAGPYEISLHDARNCATRLASAFTVTDQQTVAIAAIEPPFGWTGAATDVTLLAADPLPAGKVAFQNVPRVYLSPSSGSSLAAAAQAVGFLSPSELTAVVPTLGVGTYDVVVVNPDGSVGVLAAGFRVGADPAPVIDSASPGSIPSTTGQQLVLRGAGFAPGVGVSLYCMDALGAVTTFVTTLLTESATEVKVEPPPLPVGSTCVVRATNPDLAYGEFSAIGITNSSSNLGDFAPSSSMNVARRAPAAIQGRPTRTARFIYAMGGDTGTAAGAMASVETAQLDRFGTALAWRMLPTALPAARTLAATVRLGRFIYLAGGNDGGGPLASVLRAEVLDPADAPVIDDLLLEPDATGLAPGLWYYRVAALMPASDRNNPGGETLPSDPQPVRIPALAKGALRATIAWSEIPGAARYRIYRSPTPNLAAGNERLLAEVGGGQRTFRDTGLSTSAGQARQIGDLGEWRTVASMSHARESLGLGLGQDPLFAGRWYLYAIGGKAASGAALNSYEYLTIDVGADGSHGVGALTLGPNTLPAGRWELAAFSVDEIASTRSPPGETYLYAGPGRNAAGLVSQADGAKVLAGGPLDLWWPVGSPSFAGYGFAAAANQLFIFGGGLGPSSSTSSGLLCGIGFTCNGGPPDPPDIKNWNSIGISMSSRHLMGSTVESAHIFLIGGNTPTGPTNTVESTVW